MQIEAHCAISTLPAKARRLWDGERRSVPKAGAAAVLLCWAGNLIAAGLSHLYAEGYRFNFRHPSSLQSRRSSMCFKERPSRRTLFFSVPGITIWRYYHETTHL